MHQCNSKTIIFVVPDRNTLSIVYGFYIENKPFMNIIPVDFYIGCFAVMEELFQYNSTVGAEMRL